MQNRRGLMFIFLAVMMGLAAAWATERFVSLPSDFQAEAEVRTTPVVVIAVDVSVGATLTRDQLRLTEWPSAHLPFGALGSFEQAVDRVARRPLAAGEAVLETALFDTGAAGGLLAVISPEHRAVSVKVDSVIGVAGFVTPASWVDVLATLRRVDRKNALPYSKVILQNVRVLAVDQKLEEAKSGEPELVSVVTLEVDPVQAEHLVYAAHEGRLQLAMRSPGDDASVSTRSVGVADVLGERRTATRRAGRLVQVISGSRLTTRRF